MNPILYSPKELSFDHNGIGVLSECISCLCTEVLNGSYELDITYPVTGVWRNSIDLNSIIKVKPNYRDDPQPFRVYRIIKDGDGYITIKAAHLCYDTAGIPVLPFVAVNLQNALDSMNHIRKLENDSPFLISADFDKAGNMTVEVPTSFRALMGGGDNTINAIYGGEYHYDGYITELLEERGRNFGATIRYGKNISDFEQESDCEELYTAVFGYWYRSATDEVPSQTVYGNIIDCSGDFPYEKVLTLDVSDQFSSDGAAPTVDQIDDAVKKYMDENGIGIPKHEMKIDYVEDTNISEICVGDTIGVYYPVYNIQATARCNTVIFDCLKERNDSIKIGVVSSSIANTIASITADTTEFHRQMVDQARGLKVDFETTTSSINGKITDMRGNLAQIAVNIDEINATIDEVKTAQTNTNSLVMKANATIDNFQTVVIPKEFQALLDAYIADETSPTNVNANRITIIESFVKAMGASVLPDGTIIKGGVVLGMNTNDIKLKLENDVLYFFTGSEDMATVESALAYFAAGKMWINTALIEVLMIGTEDNNFVFKVSGTGYNRCLFISGNVK